MTDHDVSRTLGVVLLLGAAVAGLLLGSLLALAWGGLYGGWQ